MKDHSVYFSICIPVYKAEAYLEACIQSVLAQTFTDYEIILVDDGSPDNSGEICDQFAKQYSFIHVIHKNNGGPLLARHDAVRMAQGKYLLFLDSDDVFRPDALMLLEGVISKWNADMIMFDIYSFHDGERLEGFTEKYENLSIFEGENKKQLLCDFIGGTSLNSMCKKCIYCDVYDAYIDYSGYSGMIQGEDKLAALPCFDKAQRILYIKEELYGYRMNPNSTVHNITLKNYKDIQLLHEQVSVYMNKWNLPTVVKEQQKKRRLLSGYNCVISIAGRIKDGKSTQQDLREAVEYISGDVVFAEAYRSSRHLLGFYKKIVCACIMKNHVSLLQRLANIMQMRKRK